MPIPGLDALESFATGNPSSSAGATSGGDQTINAPFAVGSGASASTGLSTPILMLAGAGLLAYLLLRKKGK